jgi:hypothetical protein
MVLPLARWLAPDLRPQFGAGAGWGGLFLLNAGRNRDGSSNGGLGALLIRRGWSPSVRCENRCPSGRRREVRPCGTPGNHYGNCRLRVWPRDGGPGRTEDRMGNWGAWLCSLRKRSTSFSKARPSAKTGAVRLARGMDEPGGGSRPRPEVKLLPFSCPLALGPRE